RKLFFKRNIVLRQEQQRRAARFGDHGRHLGKVLRQERELKPALDGRANRGRKLARHPNGRETSGQSRGQNKRQKFSADITASYPPMSRTECPLWVRSRHWSASAQCPLYPQKRTLVERGAMSALCPLVSRKTE